MSRPSWAIPARCSSGSSAASKESPSLRSPSPFGLPAPSRSASANSCARTSSATGCSFPTTFTRVSPMSRYTVLITVAAAAALLAACTGEQKTPSREAAPSAPTAQVSAGGPFTPDPGGKIVTVELYTDGNGNYFKPAEVHVKRGDVVRYTLKVGVHNVHFLADSNAGKSGYPQAASDFLQLPGQTYDVLVHMQPGTYYFQCDPHAALGMKGHLVVE